MTEIEVKAVDAEEQELVDEPLLEALARQYGEVSRQAANSGFRSGGEEGTTTSGRPFDLRFQVPLAYDLRRLAVALGQAPDPKLDALLGPKVPVLLHHLVTPFAEVGNAPGGVWGFGYELEPLKLAGRTVSVAPGDERLVIGSVRQEVQLGLGLNGVLSVPSAKLDLAQNQPLLELPGVRVQASTSQELKLSLSMKLTLQKIVGAGFGAGGAKWDLYRQDEPLSVPHVLLQTLVVPEGTQRFRARVRLWAKKAGWFGTRFRALLWRYPEQEVEILLEGLGA